MKRILKLLLLIMTSLLLAKPALARTEGGRVIEAHLGGAITLSQADGTTMTLDYEGTLRAALQRRQIVIDVIGAGVIRETGEAAAFASSGQGPYRREGDRVRFRSDGQFTLWRADGTQIVIDVIGAGVIRQSGRNIVIDVIGAGVIQGSGQPVQMHIGGAGQAQTGG